MDAICLTLSIACLALESAESGGWLCDFPRQWNVSWMFIISTTVYRPSAACHPWSSDVLHVGGSSRSRLCPMAYLYFLIGGGGRAGAGREGRACVGARWKGGRGGVPL